MFANASDVVLKHSDIKFTKPILHAVQYHYEITSLHRNITHRMVNITDDFLTEVIWDGVPYEYSNNAKFKLFF